MIHVTDEAASKLLEIAEEEGLEGQHVRIKVMGGGCAGFQYDMFFEEGDPLPMDEVFENNGVTVVIDPLSFQYMDGSEMTYKDGWYAAGFKFLNPNITSKCGCGLSFGV